LPSSAGPPEVGRWIASADSEEYLTLVTYLVERQSIGNQLLRRSIEMSHTWKRWQDYATMAFGVLLFISPFVFAETSQRVATLSAYVLGVLLFLSGIAAAANREDRQSLILNAPGIVAVVTFIAPFVLGFTGVTGIAWSAWVLAVATVVVGASLSLGHRTRVTVA
jgi:uncharacterized membrane protein HdeD (DUF308 family)